MDVRYLKRIQLYIGLVQASVAFKRVGVYQDMDHVYLFYFGTLELAPCLGNKIYYDIDIYIYIHNIDLKDSLKIKEFNLGLHNSTK